MITKILITNCLPALLVFFHVSLAQSSGLPDAQNPVGGMPENVVFLDNQPGVINGSLTYDPQTRTCGAGKHQVFVDLDEAARALAKADCLLLRAGTYSRGSVGRYLTVHGNQVNYWTGALAINASGIPERRKLVSAYSNELVIIQAKPGVNHYNPDPADTSFKNSSHYFPHPAVSISGAFIEVRDLKTYGQVVISGHDIVLEDCDLGGGGPHMNQGQVLAINSNEPGGVYNVVVRNNLIHHSCWGESPANGSAVMCYNASFVVENNEFYDNWGSDIRIKDTGGQEGRSIIVRYNFFRPSSIYPQSCGVSGINQDGKVDFIRIHHNLFFRKGSGVGLDGPPLKERLVFNNTFVDCACDLSSWMKIPVNAHHNLYYHTKPRQQFYDLQSSLEELNSDYNLFFSVAGDSPWLHLYRRRGSTLADWQQYSGRDTNSVWKDPRLVNPLGSRPADFKRKREAEAIKDVKDSGSGAVCGVYVTGEEIIGRYSKIAKEN